MRAQNLQDRFAASRLCSFMDDEGFVEKHVPPPPSCDNGNSSLGISLFLDMEKEKSLFGSNEHFVLQSCF